MKIGDPILEQVNSIVNNLEKQFNAIEVIDGFDLSDSDPLALFVSIAKFLRSISDCKSSHVYIDINSDFKKIYSHPKNSISDDLFDNSILVKDSSKIVILRNILRKKVCVLSIRIDSDFLPTCNIVLVDNFFGRKNGKFHDKTFVDYIVYLSEKISGKIDRYYHAAMLNNYKSISELFLRDRINQERVIPHRDYESSDMMGSLNNRGLDEDPWVIVLKSVFDYLPVWGPFAFKEAKPLIQILTVQKGRSFLRLRAESEYDDSDGQWKIVSKNLQLDRKWTICGMLLDMEDKGIKQDFLLLNPQKHQSRYASLMYPIGDTPCSELVLPIYGLDGKIIAVLNFEHELEGSFSDYHVRMLKLMIADVEQLVRYLLVSYESIIDMEKKLRYLMLRIASKLSSTQSHRLKNDFGSLMSALYEAEWEVKDGSKEGALEYIELASKAVEELKKISLDFTINVEDYIIYRARKIESVIKDALPDAQKRAELAGDNIIIASDGAPNDTLVFCSGMAREHIHNVLQNAIDQFVIRRRSDEKFVGLIEIGTNLVPMSDPKKNVHTVDLFAITFRDNGGGIPPGKEDWIFEMNKSTKRSDGGQGYGLAAALEYMEKIGGKLLLLENRPGDGATFSMQFPIYTEALHEAMAESLNVEGVR